MLCYVRFDLIRDLSLCFTILLCVCDSSLFRFFKHDSSLSNGIDDSELFFSGNKVPPRSRGLPESHVLKSFLTDKESNVAKIKVVVRKRPLNKKEIAKKEEDIITIDSKFLTVHERKFKEDGTAINRFSRKQPKILRDLMITLCAHCTSSTLEDSIQEKQSAFLEDTTLEKLGVISFNKGYTTIKAQDNQTQSLLRGRGPLFADQQLMAEEKTARLVSG